MRSSPLTVVALVVALAPACAVTGTGREPTSAPPESPASAVPLGHRVLQVDESADDTTVLLDLGDRLVVTLHGPWQAPTGLGQQGPTGQDRVLVRQEGSASSGAKPASGWFLATAPGRDEVTASRTPPSGVRFAVTVVVR